MGCASDPQEDTAAAKPGASDSAGAANTTTDQSKGTFLAVVQKDGGKPVEGAIFGIKSSTSKEPHPDIAPLTDAEGRVRWSLAPGDYVFGIHAEGYQEHEEKVTLEAGKTVSRTITLKPK